MQDPTMMPMHHSDFQQASPRFEPELHTPDLGPLRSELGPSASNLQMPPRHLFKAVSDPRGFMSFGGHHYQPEGKKKLMPRPKSPMEYKVLRTVLMRVGRSLQSSKLQRVRAGSVVLVNTVRGRRARLVKRLSNGETQNVGWVSLRTEQGDPLLVQLDEELGTYQHYPSQIAVME